MTRNTVDSYAAGLTTRPVADTAAATLRWMSDEPEAVRHGGLSGDKEAVLLRKWATRPAG